jgi:hypoxanthine phosphoribosyltransferase
VIDQTDHYSGFSGVYSLGHYIPQDHAERDAFSDQIDRFKANRDDVIDAWANVVKESFSNNKLRFDFIIRALGPEETAATDRPEMDNIARAIASVTGGQYTPHFLTKSSSSDALASLEKSARIKKLNEIYSFNTWTRDPDKRILIIDDVVQTAATLSAIYMVVRSKCPNAKIYFFSLATVFDSDPGLEKNCELFNRLHIRSEQAASNPESISAVQTGDHNFESYTPYQLGESNSNQAIPYLIKYLRAGDNNERRLAASAIYKLSVSFGEETKECVPFLVGNLKSNAPQVRQYTLKALSTFSLPNKILRIIRDMSESDDKDYNRSLARDIISKGKWPAHLLDVED